jgi:hypothetical protein
VVMPMHLPVCAPVTRLMGVARPEVDSP